MARRQFNAPNVVGEWNADEFILQNERAAARGIGLATQHYIAKLKDVLSLPGPTKSHATGDVVQSLTAPGFIGPGTPIKVRASFPGEPPRKRTGALRASEKGVKADTNGLVWLAGSNQKYALALEKGYPPRNLKPRPHLAVTLERESDAMFAIVAREMESA